MSKNTIQHYKGALKLFADFCQKQALVGNLMGMALNEIRSSREIAQTTSVRVGRMDERLGQVIGSTARLKNDIFGNGFRD
ncbi:MAG TPA: hypothetical protein VF498_15825 [Anaerolineales bacterium]